MAFTFNCVQMDPNQNSYVCDTEADDYFDGDPRSGTWSALATAEKQQYLAAATNRLEMETYGGQITDSSQPLQWPRSFVIDRTLGYYDDQTVPKQMKQATIEMAMWILDELAGTALVSRTDMARMKNFSVGPLTVAMRKVKESALPDVVVRLLKSIGPNGWKGAAPMKLVR